MLPILPLLSLSSFNLSGSWQLVSSSEGYSVSPQPGGAPLVNYSVACVAGPCTAWRAANLSVLDPATGAVFVAFDSGLANGGSLGGSPFAYRIAWADGSVWAQATPLPDELEVHLMPHTHSFVI